MPAAGKAKKTKGIKDLLLVACLFLAVTSAQGQMPLAPKSADTIARQPIPELKTFFLPDLPLPSTAPTSPFCRLEWQWEKKTKLPLRIRLGTLDYVDQLEGKGRLRKLE